MVGEDFEFLTVQDGSARGYSMYNGESFAFRRLNFFSAALKVREKNTTGRRDTSEYF